jgi:hypothetical protein
MVEAVLQWIRANPAEAAIALLFAGVLLGYPINVVAGLTTEPIKDWWNRGNFQEIRKRLTAEQKALDRVTRCHDDPALLQAELVGKGLTLLVAVAFGLLLLTLALLIGMAPTRDAGSVDRGNALGLVMGAAMAAFLLGGIIGFDAVVLHRNVQNFEKYKAEREKAIARLTAKLPPKAA